MSNSEPKISIIIPVYNVERYLEQCVRSVMCQTYKELEIILVNDGSPDNSLSICHALQREDSRILIISQENRGLPSARNAGLDAATGSYIMFADSDDFVHPDMCRVALETAQATDSDIVEFGYFRTDMSGKPIDKNELEPSVLLGSEECVRTQLSPKHTNCVWNKIYHSSLFSDLRFPPLCISEDSVMNVLLSAICNKHTVIADCLYYYRFNPDSITHSAYSIGKGKDCIKAGQLVYDFINEHECYHTMQPLAAQFSTSRIPHIYYLHWRVQKTDVDGSLAALSNKYKEFYPLAMQAPDSIFWKWSVLMRIFYFSPTLYCYIWKFFKG